MQILKNINNNKMSLTVTRIEAQKEDIIEERELREDEDFSSFHQGNVTTDNVGMVTEKVTPLEVKKQINNPFSRVNAQPVNETKKNVNAGGFSFGITVKRS
jgi:hypothetical protein